MKFPATRTGLTHKFVIHATTGRIKGFITANRLANGHLGEVFIHMDHAEESLRGMARSLCLVISKALQHGVAAATIIQSLSGQRFEPSGITKHPSIHFCKSLSDYIAQWLSLEFCASPERTQNPEHTQPGPDTPGLTP